MNTLDITLLTDLNKSTYEAGKRVADLNFSTFEKLFTLQANAVNSYFESATANMEALKKVSTAQEALTLQADFARKTGEKAVADYQEGVTVLTTARDEMTKLTEENLKEAANTTEKVQKLVTENAEKLQSTISENAEKFQSAVSEQVEKVQTTMKTSAKKAA